MKPFLSRFALLFALIFALSVPQLYAADLTVTAANVAVSSEATLVPGVCGETLTAGKVVYQSALDNRYYVADCTILAKSVVAGIAVTGGAAGQPCVICTEDPNFTPGATISMSVPIYVLSAAGAICPSADVTTGDYCTVLFVSRSTTKAAFRARGHAGAVLVVAP